MRVGLREKIIGASVAPLAAVLIAVAAYDASADGELVQESRRAAQDLSEAMQVSVQQLGKTVKPDKDLLDDYTKRFGRSGIRQITVLSPEKERLATGSAPAKKPHAFLIEVARQKDAGAQTWDLLVPVVIGANKLGYVQLTMTSQGFEDLLGAIRRRRIGITACAFTVGLILLGLLASQISRPVVALRAAAERVARGDLEVALPRPSSDEIGELVHSFSRMVEGLKERERLKDQLEHAERDALLGKMAAVIAHDVRNPLNYLSLGIDHLMATIRPTPETEKIGGQMKSELARANQRIAEFLRLGKRVEVHPSEIAVKSLLEAVSSAAASPGIEMRVYAEAVGTVWWDPTVVEGILRNLVTNALQASEGRPHADIVDLIATAEGEDRISILVEDRGVGLDQDTIARIFEPWFTTKSGGVGLGLALARQAAREHGGDLQASPRGGGGARFMLTLPRDARRSNS